MCSYVSFSKVTVALCGLFSASDAGVTERDVIFPLLAVSMQKSAKEAFYDLPETEKVSHFLLARVVGNVLDLEFHMSASRARERKTVKPT